MKKISLFLIMVLFLITGCGKIKKEDVINNFKNKVNRSKSYEIVGTMEIMSNEDIFKYELNAKYLHKDIDYYKVTLVNKTNNHEQIILKNSEGVYVITPSLNKSFKFQSNWPNNSSQSYLLESLVNDMKKDTKSSFEEKDGKYIIKNKVNYPNNEELVYEKVYLNKKNLPEKVEVYDNNDHVKIKVVFNKIDLNAGNMEDEFELSNIIKEPECDDKCKEEKEKKKEDNKIDEKKQDEPTEEEQTKQEENKQTSSIQDVIYPLYVPQNTSLKSKDVISTENGQRVILTFAGDNSFVLVEETMNISDEFEIIPVYGDPEMINDSIGALGSNSLSWTSNNINYYLTGTDLKKTDLISIATSMNNTSSVSLEK